MSPPWPLPAGSVLTSCINLAGVDHACLWADVRLFLTLFLTLPKPALPCRACFDLGRSPVLILAQAQSVPLFLWPSAHTRTTPEAPAACPTKPTWSEKNSAKRVCSPGHYPCHRLLRGEAVPKLWSIVSVATLVGIRPLLGCPWTSCFHISFCNGPSQVSGKLKLT